MSEMGQDDWTLKCRDVKKIVEVYLLREPVTHSFVIRLSDDDEDEKTLTTQQTKSQLVISQPTRSFIDDCN